MLPESTSYISTITEAPSSDLKPTAYPANRIPVPGHMYLSLHIGLVDKSMRVYATDARPRVSDIGGTATNKFQLIYVSEGTSVAKAMFAGGNMLVTADVTGVLTVWRYTVNGSGFSRGDIKMVLDARLRGHVDSVTCMASSPAWSIFVSGSNVSGSIRSPLLINQDGTAIVWDTNALRYIRTLSMDCGESIEHCAIHNASVRLHCFEADEPGSHPIGIEDPPPNLHAEWRFYSCRSREESRVAIVIHIRNHYTRVCKWTCRSFRRTGVLGARILKGRSDVRCWSWARCRSLAVRSRYRW
jgi:WD40 repeat protein